MTEAISAAAWSPQSPKLLTVKKGVTLKKVMIGEINLNISILLVVILLRYYLQLRHHHRLTLCL